MSGPNYDNDGYTVVPLFDPAIVAAARGDIVEHLDRVSRALYLPFEASCPDAPLETRLDRIWARDRSQATLLRSAICTDAHRGPRLQALARSPALIEAAEAIGGRRLEADRIERVRASIWVFPEHAHAWHSDVARDDGSSCGRVWITAWIPLSDAGPGHGGLELAAGRRSQALPHGGERGFSIADAAIGDAPRVRPTVPAGSVLFLDRFTPHRSLPPGPEARFALVIWMKAE